MSIAGKAKVKYMCIAGMCDAKLKNHYMNIIISNQNYPNSYVIW